MMCANAYDLISKTQELFTFQNDWFQTKRIEEKRQKNMTKFISFLLLLIIDYLNLKIQKT